MTDKPHATLDTGKKERTINVGSTQLPQKMYSLRMYDKVVLLLYMLLSILLIVPFAIASLIPDGLEVSARIAFLVTAVVAMVILSGVFFRAWSRRLEFSPEGVTLYSFFYRIHAPWANIAGYDKDARCPVPYRGTHSLYGGFVYKEPAILDVPLRRGREDHVTVVQFPRFLRSRTNPDLVAYLSHYLPVFPELLPERELSLLVSLARDEQRV